MRVRAQVLEPNINRVIKKVVVAVDEAVVDETPVDTGRARSNWRVSVGAPTTEVISPYAPGRHLGKAEVGNAAAAKAQAREAVSVRAPGQDVYLCNSTPYIGLLNAGHSGQAAPLFVQRAVLRGLEVIRSIRLREIFGGN